MKLFTTFLSDGHRKRGERNRIGDLWFYEHKTTFVPVENQYFSFITDIFEIIKGYTKITWSELNMIWPLAFCQISEISQITLFAIVA